MKKINDVKVLPIPIKGAGGKKFPGYKIFSENKYPNIFLLAKKNSGKTSTIFTIIKQYLEKKKNKKVIIFSSTVNKDANWIFITKWLKSKKIEYETHTSLKEDGINKLKEFYEQLEGGEESDEENEEVIEKDKHFSLIKYDSESESESEDDRNRSSDKSDRDSNYNKMEYIIIFDDFSIELKDKSVGYFLKRNRHFKSTVLISSQYFNDLSKDSRLQLDLVLLFQNLPDEKVEEVRSDCDINIPKKTFLTIYKQVTEEKYNFLYVNCRNGELRKNFDKKF